LVDLIQPLFGLALMIQVISKWQKLKHGSLNVGFETALTAPKFTVKRGGRLKIFNLVIQAIEYLLDGFHFFLELHRVKIHNTSARPIR
jgi:hypothetical protein